MCFLLKVWKFSHSKKTELDITINLHWSSCKYTRYSCQIFLKIIFFTDFRKKYSNIKFHENPSSGSRVFHADGRTDVTEIRIAFINFANACRNHSRTRNTKSVLADEMKVQHRKYGRFKLRSSEVYDRPTIA